MPDITDLSPLLDTDVVDADELVIYDVSAGTGNSKKITRANLLHDVVREDGDHNLGIVEIDDLTAETSSLTFTDGSTLTGVLAESLSVAPADILTGAFETVAVTLTGVTTAHFLSYAFTAALPDGLLCQAWISAANTVSFRFANTTGGTITGATYTARVTAISVA